MNPILSDFEKVMKSLLIASFLLIFGYFEFFLFLLVLKLFDQQVFTNTIILRCWQLTVAYVLITAQILNHLHHLKV